jgi:hypothetical protein
MGHCDIQEGTGVRRMAQVLVWTCLNELVSGTDRELILPFRNKTGSKCQTQLNSTYDNGAVLI